MNPSSGNIVIAGVHHVLVLAWAYIAGYLACGAEMALKSSTRRVAHKKVLNARCVVAFD